MFLRLRYLASTPDEIIKNESVFIKISEEQNLKNLRDQDFKMKHFYSLHLYDIWIDSRYLNKMRNVIIDMSIYDSIVSSYPRYSYYCIFMTVDGTYCFDARDGDIVPPPCGQHGFRPTYARLSLTMRGSVSLRVLVQGIPRNVHICSVNHLVW